MARRSSSEVESEARELLKFFLEVGDFLGDVEPSFTRSWRLSRDAIVSTQSAAPGTPYQRLAGVREGVADLLQVSAALSSEQIRDLDVRLAEKHLPTLTDKRRELWGRRIPAILKRRRIRSDAEYHLLKEVVDGSGMPALDDAGMNLARRLVDEYG